MYCVCLFYYYIFGFSKFQCHLGTVKTLGRQSRVVGCNPTHYEESEDARKVLYICGIIIECPENGFDEPVCELEGIAPEKKKSYEDFATKVGSRLLEIVALRFLTAVVVALLIGFYWIFNIKDVNFRNFVIGLTGLPTAMSNEIQRWFHGNFMSVSTGVGYVGDYEEVPFFGYRHGFFCGLFTNIWGEIRLVYYHHRRNFRKFLSWPQSFYSKVIDSANNNGIGEKTLIGGGLVLVILGAIVYNRRRVRKGIKRVGRGTYLVYSESKSFFIRGKDLLLSKTFRRNREAAKVVAAEVLQCETRKPKVSESGSLESRKRKISVYDVYDAKTGEIVRLGDGVRLRELVQFLADSEGEFVHLDENEEAYFRANPDAMYQLMAEKYGDPPSEDEFDSEEEERRYEEKIHGVFGSEHVDSMFVGKKSGRDLFDYGETLQGVELKTAILGFFTRFGKFFSRKEAKSLVTKPIEEKLEGVWLDSILAMTGVRKRWNLSPEERIVNLTPVPDFTPALEVEKAEVKVVTNNDPLLEVKKVMSRIEKVVDNIGKKSNDTQKRESKSEKLENKADKKPAVIAKEAQKSNPERVPKKKTKTVKFDEKLEADEDGFKPVVRKGKQDIQTSFPLPASGSLEGTTGMAPLPNRHLQALWYVEQNSQFLLWAVAVKVGSERFFITNYHTWRNVDDSKPFFLKSLNGKFVEDGSRFRHFGAVKPNGKDSWEDMAKLVSSHPIPGVVMQLSDKEPRVGMEVAVATDFGGQIHFDRDQISEVSDAGFTKSLFHRVNTREGTCGLPVCDMDGRLLAIHFIFKNQQAGPNRLNGGLACPKSVFEKLVSAISLKRLVELAKGYTAVDALSQEGRHKVHPGTTDNRPRNRVDKNRISPTTASGSAKTERGSSSGGDS
jgi:hypothetical protein